MQTVFHQVIINLIDDEMIRFLHVILVTYITLILLSCKSKQSIVTESDASSSITDTTKILAYINTYSALTIDTTKTDTTYEGVGVIEFVEGGGKVSIDSAGNVTFEGVKNIKGQHKGSIAQNKGLTQKAEEAAGHREQLNGVTAGQTQHEKRIEEKAPAQKWYETALARVGLGVCISALLWLLFLYLKRKR